MIDLKRINRLFLVGPMGAGKTTVGRELARNLGEDFYDLDAMIEEKCGVSVARIFDLEGEAGFRAREKALFADVCTLDRFVLATGGGTVLDKDNRALLRRRGFVIYLHTPVTLQLERVSRDKTRPLLETGDRRARLEALLAERDPLYREVADLVVESETGRPAACARRVLEQLAMMGRSNP